MISFKSTTLESEIPDRKLPISSQKELWLAVHFKVQFNKIELYLSTSKVSDIHDNVCVTDEKETLKWAGERKQN